MKQYIIFGANNTAKYFLKLNKYVKNVIFVDNDKTIKFFQKRKVLRFSELLKIKNKNDIIICSSQFYNIYKQLKKSNLSNKIKFFFEYNFKKKIFFNIISHQPDFLVSNEILKQKSNIIDVGGNVGFFSLFLYLKGKINFSFIIEPQKHMCNSMQILFKKFNFKEYKIINSCISNRNNKFLKLYIPKKENLIFSGRSSLIKKFNKHLDIEPLKVKNYKIDKLVNKELNKIKKIDLIKIDVEGYEIPILQGFRDLILKKKPIVYVEVLKINFNKFLKVVEKEFNSFSLYQIYEKKLCKYEKKYLSMHNYLIYKD